MEGIEALMRHVYIFPLVGAALGAIFALVAYVLGLVLPGNLVAVFVIASIYRVCGINHIDGLADFGDGVIAHGSLEKKIKAMKDVSLGSGGCVFITVLLISLFTVISSIDSQVLPVVLLVSEVSAKQSMITFSAFTTPFQKGLGSMMIERTRFRDFLAGLVFSAALSGLALGITGLAMLGSAAITGLYLVRVSGRNFGGGSGDGMGASNEISRVIALAVALVLGVRGWTLL